MIYILAALIISCFCVAELSLAGVTPSLVSFGVIAIGAWTMISLGYLVYGLAEPKSKDERISLLLPLVIGTAATNLIVIALINFATISAARAFIFFAAGVAAVTILSLFSNGGLRNKVSVARYFSIDQSDLSDILSLAILSIVVLAWSHSQAAAFPSLQKTGIAPVWRDIFLHADQIAQYARVDGLARGSVLMVGGQIELYHRAIYALPAAISQLVNIPPYAAATALLLPMGLLVCLVGVTALGNTLARDRTTGMLASLLLVILPDAANYGMRNGFFSFTWLTFVAPGTGWAMGICAASLALFCRWLREGGSGLIYLTTALALALFWHRVHLMILFMPTLAVLAFLYSPRGTILLNPHKRNKIALFIGLLMSAFIIVLLSPELRTLWLRFSAVEEFLSWAHSNNEPTAYTGIYSHLVDRYGLQLAILAGILMTLPAILGLLLLIWPLLFLAKRSRIGFEPIDIFPLLLMVIYLSIVLFAPAASINDRSNEYQHRVFPLLYTIILTYCVFYASLILKQFQFSLPISPDVVQRGLIALFFIYSGLSFKDSDQSKPVFAWGSQLYSLAVDRSIVRTSEYLASHAGKFDVFAVVPAEPDAFTHDISSKIVALSGISAFLSLAGRKSLERRDIIAQRLALLDDVQHYVTRKSAFESLQKHGINWLVVRFNDVVAWDKEHKYAAFQDGTYAVYRINDHL